MAGSSTPTPVCRKALIPLTFKLELILINGELIGPEPIVTFFESPRRRALLKEIIDAVARYNPLMMIAS